MNRTAKHDYFRIGPDYSRAYELYGEIEDAGVLEDRREYTREDLTLAYPDENEYTIDRLYDLIQTDFYTDVEGEAWQWDRLLKALRIKKIGGGSHLSDLAAQRLGHYVFDYMLAAMFDCNWEGFNDAELWGIKVLLRDMAIGAEAEREHNTYGSEEV